MAQGSVVRFNGTTDQLGEALWDLDTFSLKASLVTIVPAANNGATAGYPVFSDYTEVSGGTYASKTLVVTTDYTWTRSGTDTTLALNTSTHTDGKLTWSQDAASGPENIKGLILSETTNNRVLLGWDMTPDGTTAISMKSGDIVVQFDASGTPGNIGKLTQV